MKEWYKICPHCGKEIKAIAIKCQHCLKFLDKEPEKNTKKCPFCLNEIDINGRECPFCDEILKRSKIKLPVKSFWSKKIIYSIIWVVILLLTILLAVYFWNKRNNNSYKDWKCKNTYSEYEHTLGYEDPFTNRFNKDLQLLLGVSIMYSPVENKCLWFYREYDNNHKDDIFTIMDVENWIKISEYHHNYNTNRCFWYSKFLWTTMEKSWNDCNVLKIWMDEESKLMWQ